MTDEHRTAVEWLNNHTDERVSFFVVRPEVFRIDDSKPAVRFELEVAPSEFGRRLRSVTATGERPSYAFRRKFWDDLLRFLEANGHPWAHGRSTTKDAWISSGVGRSGIGANISMATHSRMRVDIYCSNDASKSQFESLLKHKQDIEARFPDEQVSWERLEDATASRVAVYRPYEKDRVSEDTSERQQLFKWIGQNLEQMREVAKRYLVDRSPLGRQQD